ncbi:hypothetical protein MBAV_000466, partial [Candidatus Magnetobacterium bavaricum]
MADEFSKYKDEVDLLRSRILEMEQRKQTELNTPREEKPPQVQAPLQRDAWAAEESPPPPPQQRVAVPERVPTPEPSRPVSTEAESPRGPVGLDLGTSNIVMAQNKGTDLH